MKAVVLCAGYGTRLGELTRNIPKPMLPVAGKPLLEYILRNLVLNGFDEIAVNLHFNSDQITNYFGDGSQLKLKLTYFYEKKLLGTAGSVKNMMPFLEKEENFLVHYGDILTDQEFNGMLQVHRRMNADATLLVHRRSKSNSIVELNKENRITGFLERPPDEQKKITVDSTWVNSGICIMNMGLVDLIPDNTLSDLPKDVFATCYNTCKLFGYPLNGFRIAIDSQQRYMEAQIAVGRGELKFK